MTFRLQILISMALVWQMTCPSSARSDVIVLKSGGELRGELQPELQTRPDSKAKSHESEAAPAFVSIRTIAGALVTVALDEVESVVRRRAVLEEHETLSRAAPETVESQWELAEWCRDRSLSKERSIHLQRIIQIDPDHTAAHRGLGHIRHEGRWTTNEQLMTARGYIKYKGKFVLPQELELIEAEERDNESEKAWHKRIHLWRLWLDSDNPDRQAEAFRELKAIRDADAVSALVRVFRNESHEQLRILLVEILSHIEGEKPIGPLVQQSLNDESQLVRTASVRGVREVGITAALPIYLRSLKSEKNLIVNRAATALGQLGDETVIPLLIEALITRHRYKMLVPAQSTSVSTDGSMSSGAQLPPEVAAMLATGQLPNGVQINTPGLKLPMKQVTIQKDEQNSSVLTALGTLTGENFGYNEQAWRNWHRAKSAGAVKSKKKSASPK